MKNFLMAATGGILAGAVLTTQIAGPLLAQEAAKTSNVYEQLDLFGDIFERIRAQYVEEVEPSELIEAAINGMLTSLDPHSSYLDAEAYKELRVGTTGEFGGLGIEVAMEDGFVKVVTPIDDTPAQRAGLRVESGLGELVAADAAAEPGALPLVSHALRETWRRRRGSTLTIADYREAGGVRGAIASTADDLVSTAAFCGTAAMVHTDLGDIDHFAAAGTRRRRPEARTPATSQRGRRRP